MQHREAKASVPSLTHSILRNNEKSALRIFRPLQRRHAYEQGLDRRCYSQMARPSEPASEAHLVVEETPRSSHRRQKSMLWTKCHSNSAMSRSRTRCALQRLAKIPLLQSRMIHSPSVYGVRIARHRWRFPRSTDPPCGEGQLKLKTCVFA